PEQTHLPVQRYGRKVLRLIERERRSLPAAQVVGFEQQKVSRAFVASRTRGNYPYGRGMRISSVIDVVVIGDREASPVGAEVWNVLVFPDACLQLSEIRGEPPGLPVVSAEGFHQAVGGKARRLAALIEGFRQGVGDVNDDERDERSPERHEGHPQPARADALIHPSASFPVLSPKPCRESFPSVEWTSRDASIGVVGSGVGGGWLAESGSGRGRESSR